MEDSRLQVLLVEDNADHARLIERRLGQLRLVTADVRRVASFTAALECLKTSNFDVVLLDLRLPDSGLEETLPRMTAAAPQLPIIVLTSLEEFEFAVGLVKQGAQDYIVKSSITPELLSRAILYSIERKRIQRDLQHYAAELERTNRELDQFTRVVSHDLKSPLAVVQMDLKAIERKSRDKGSSWSEHLQGALQTVQQMNRLIDDLLLYARSGDDDANREPVECDELLRQLISELKPRIESAEAKITLDPLPRIAGNPTRLRQVFQNLITNALSHHGGRKPEVHISAEFEQRIWIFSVADNGAGIAEEDRERVFDMFSRACGDEVPGTGVGLSICRRVVESHGGRIWLESEVGRGTTFYFSLPLKPPCCSGQTKTGPPQREGNA